MKSTAIAALILSQCLALASGACLLCQGGVSGIKRPNYYVDEYQTTCMKVMMTAFRIQDSSSTECRWQIMQHRKTCCGDEEPPPITQIVTAAPEYKVEKTGKFDSCDVCRQGNYPGKPGGIINMLYVGEGSCRDYYEAGRGGYILPHLCDTLKYFAYEPCGCQMTEIGNDANLGKAPPADTPKPTPAPVAVVTSKPTNAPATPSPTKIPTLAPTTATPTLGPTLPPTTAMPTLGPTLPPTTATPTLGPTLPPTTATPTTASPTTAKPFTTQATNNGITVTISVGKPTNANANANSIAYDQDTNSNMLAYNDRRTVYDDGKDTVAKMSDGSRGGQGGLRRQLKGGRRRQRGKRVMATTSS